MGLLLLIIHFFFFSHLLLDMLIMSIGKVLFLWVLYYFVFFSFHIVYMLWFVKLCKSFVEKEKKYLWFLYDSNICVQVPFVEVLKSVPIGQNS